MENLLILTDLSETAYNAAQYGCMLASQYRAKRIILFHSYPIVVPGTDTPVIIPASGDSDDLYENYIKELESLREQLKGLVDPGTRIDVMADVITLPEIINSLCRKEHVDLVIMGMKGKTNLEKILVGSSAISVVEKSEYPVLIIPGDAEFQKYENILFTSDLDKVSETTPVDSLARLLDVLNVKLYVLNVDNKEKHFSPGTPIEIEALHQILDKYSPQYYFTDNPDIADGIFEFAGAHDINLIITIPKKHGLLKGLFHRSISHKIIHHSTIPLLCIHE